MKKTFLVYISGKLEALEIEALNTTEAIKIAMYTYPERQVLRTEVKNMRKGLGFEMALTAMKTGKKVRRKCWVKSSHLIIKDNSICFKGDGDGNFMQGYFLTSTMVLAEDWEVI